MNDVKIIKFWVMNWIIIHLGKNPKNGGNPPKDIIAINRINFIIFWLFIELKVWEIYDKFIVVVKRVIEKMLII